MTKLCIKWALAASSLTVASPALAENPWDSNSTDDAALRYEVGYLALSAIDTFQTVDCLRRDMCQEVNPLFGKHPSAGKLILAKAVGGALHFTIFNHLRGEDPRMAMRVAQVSCAIQGGVVALNARFSF